MSTLAGFSNKWGYDRTKICEAIECSNKTVENGMEIQKSKYCSGGTKPCCKLQKTVSQKIHFIYDNHEYINLTNKAFLMHTKTEHLAQPTSQIEIWLHIHLLDIQVSITKTNPSTTWTKYKRQRKRKLYRVNKIYWKRWTIMVPCKAEKVSNGSFYRDSTLI